jgi:hypothetical protein
MTNNKSMSDTDLILKLVLEIKDSFNCLLDILPTVNEDILKHIAASSIHLSLFMRDFHDLIIGKKTDIDPKLEKQFLEECGCDFNKDKK